MPSVRNRAWLADTTSLANLGLRSWAELLGDSGVQDAMALIKSRPDAATMRRAGLDPVRSARLNADALAALPLSSLQRLSPALRRGLPATLGVSSVGELAKAAAIIQRVTELDEAAEPDPFHEPPSAPRDLIPRSTGAIAASANYTQFVREHPLSLADLGLEIQVDQALVRTVDPRLLAAFQFDPTPILQLGYMAGFRQDWISQGTFLGEPLQSIGLAPGETRRIAIIDWQRRVASQRDEDTDISESLSNVVTHQRSLAEVVSSTAREVQSGGTSLAAGTLATAVGAVGAGALVGGLGGAAIGAAAGSAAAGVGAIPGSLVGLGVGAVAGGIGAAVTASGNGQLGVVESDTSGRRDISANFSQRVNDVSMQKATALRSVMSTVVVSAEESERDALSTRAIANHNHAHALTIQYFEVLQHYRARVQHTRHQGLLFFPIQPLIFDGDLVLSHWESLRLGFSGNRRARFDLMVARSRQLSASPLLAEDFKPSEVEVNQITVIGVPRGRRLSLRARLDALDALPFSRIGNTRVQRLNLIGKAARIDDIYGLMLPLSTADLLGRGIGSSTGSNNGENDLRVSVTIDTEPQTTLQLTISSEGDDGRIALDLRSALEQARQDAREAEDAANDLVELVEAINSRPYRFTRLLVLSLEPEQLREVIEALVVVKKTTAATSSRGGGRSGPVNPPLRLDRRQILQHLPDDRQLGANAALLDTIREKFKTVPRQSGIPLSCLVDTQPFGWSDGMLVMKLRHLRNKDHTAKDFQQVSKQLPELEVLRDYPAELATTLPAIAEQESDQSIFLPTGGHFAEAILGRSNSAERLDGTRHIFWHELPNPLVATEIAALAAGSRAQPLPDLKPTEANTVLTQAAPTNVPDPTLGAAAMAVLSQQNLFRDMSKTGELVGVLNNLSTLAQTMANKAGDLAGTAQEQTLQQAGALAQQIATLTEKMFQTVNGGQLPVDASATQRAVAGNRVQDLASTPLPNLPGRQGGSPGIDTNGAVARSFGAPIGQVDAFTGERGAQPSQTAFLAPGEPFAQRSEADAIRESLPESLRAPTDAGVLIRSDLRNTPENIEAEATRRITSTFTNELQPLLQNITADDATFDRALRLALDLQSVHQLSGLDGAGPLGQAAPALADGWRASRQRAITAITNSKTLSTLPRLQTLMFIAQSGLDLGLNDNETNLDKALEEAGVVLQIDRFDRPTQVAAGDAVDVIVRVMLRIGTGSAAPLPNARVIITALETHEGELRTTTAADGIAQVRLTHDPLHLGADVDGPLTPNLGLRVAVLALHPDFTAIQTDAQGDIPGKLSLILIEAIHEDDGSNALAGSVVVPQPARPIIATMQFLSAGVPVRDAPVSVSVNGSVSVQQFTRRTGSADQRGRLTMTLVPGAAGSGISFVAVSAEAPDGRVVAGRIDMQSP